MKKRLAKKIRKAGKEHPRGDIKVISSCGCVFCDLECCTPEKHVAAGPAEEVDHGQ